MTEKDPFAEYIKQLSLSRQELGWAWAAGIGLQDVDNLKPSHYLYETAKKNIDGEISLDEADKLIHSYYENKENSHDNRSEEADKVATRIAKLLSENAFVFSPAQYISIHKELFYGIYQHAGKIRDYNISKKEWVLNGDTVLYASARDLQATLDYDFSQERNFQYNGLNINDIIQHIAIFISKLWQIHPFGEGNTRTTAVFLIKYLRHLGFYVNNDLFAKHSWYFRNALVRANYNNLSKQVYKTSEYIEKFLRHLLKQEHNELHNREMHIDKAFSLKNEPINNQNEPINEPIKFNAREQSIIALLKENPNIKRHQMAECLACSESTVKRTLHALIAKGIIRRVGANKNGQWIVEKYFTTLMR